MSPSDPGASTQSDGGDSAPCPYCLIIHRNSRAEGKVAEDCIRAMGLRVFALLERVQDLEHANEELSFRLARAGIHEDED